MNASAAGAVSNGVDYGSGTVTATVDAALGELADQPPGYPTDPKPVRVTLRCTSATACTVTAFSVTEGRTNPLESSIGPLPLKGTKSFPQPADDECPVGTTLTSNLTVAGKRKIAHKTYPASVSGTVVFAWPVGEQPTGLDYEPSDPCGGETWTYTFSKAKPTAR